MSRRAEEPILADRGLSRIAAGRNARSPASHTNSSLLPSLTLRPAGAIVVIETHHIEVARWITQMSDRDSTRTAPAAQPGTTKPMARRPRTRLFNPGLQPTVNGRTCAQPLGWYGLPVAREETPKVAIERTRIQDLTIAKDAAENVGPRSTLPQRRYPGWVTPRTSGRMTRAAARWAAVGVEFLPPISGRTPCTRKVHERVDRLSPARRPAGRACAGATVRCDDETAAPSFEEASA